MLDVARELGKVAEPFVQKAVEHRRIDRQVTVHDHVAKARNPAEAAHKFRWQDAELVECVKGGGVVRAGKPR